MLASLKESLKEAVTRRRWPLAATALVIGAGMAYSFLWAPVVRHKMGWQTPGDLWATLRGAHYVGWGYLGGVYGAGTALVTFPGILILLAPVAMLSSGLNLSEAFPFAIPHPTAWLLVGPLTLALAAVPLCALDALAEVRGISAGRRRALVVAEAGVVYGTVAIWGHPEDALALGLLVYALVAIYRSRWRAAGWLVGTAVLMQPLTLLAFPAVLMWAPARERLGLVVRSALPATSVVGVVLAVDFRDTWTALTRQPNYPTVDHATPWVWLAPHLSRTTVGSGPGRIVALGVAIAIGAWVHRRRAGGQPVDLTRMVTLALAARCVFEPVMVPYYLIPALSLAVMLAWEGEWWRLALAVPLGAGLTVVPYTHAVPVVWWLEMMAFLVGLLVTARWHAGTVRLASASDEHGSGGAGSRFVRAGHWLVPQRRGVEAATAGVAG